MDKTSNKNTNYKIQKKRALKHFGFWCRFKRATPEGGGGCNRRGVVYDKRIRYGDHTGLPCCTIEKKVMSDR